MIDWHSVLWAVTITDDTHIHMETAITHTHTHTHTPHTHMHTMHVAINTMLTVLYHVHAAAIHTLSKQEPQAYSKAGESFRCCRLFTQVYSKHATCEDDFEGKTCTLSFSALRTLAKP